MVQTLIEVEGYIVVIAFNQMSKDTKALGGTIMSRTRPIALAETIKCFDSLLVSELVESRLA
jgi:hypothetical protein